MPEPNPLPAPSRRSFLVATASLLSGALLSCKRLIVWQLTNNDNSVFDPTSHSFEDGDLCVLTADAVEGPYLIPGEEERRDLREGRPGQDLRLGLRVVEADGCRPIAGAQVAIWSCDALGNYSGFSYAGPEELPPVQPDQRASPDTRDRFLRGVQTTDADGHVEFLTLFPGWYLPRVQHIHVQVRVGDRALKTAHIYFPQAWIDASQKQSPYDQRTPSPATNLNDFVLNESRGQDGGWPRMSKDGDTWVGTLTLGVPASNA